MSRQDDSQKFKLCWHASLGLSLLRSRCSYYFGYEPIRLTSPLRLTSPCSRLFWLVHKATLLGGAPMTSKPLAICHSFGFTAGRSSLSTWLASGLGGVPCSLVWLHSREKFPVTHALAWLYGWEKFPVLYRTYLIGFYSWEKFPWSLVWPYMAGRSSLRADALLTCLALRLGEVPLFNIRT